MINKSSTTVGTIQILVRPGQFSLSPGRDNSAAALSKHVSRFLEEVVDDLAIPGTVEVTVQDPKPGLSFVVSINDEPCRMRREFGNGGLSAKNLAVKIADIVLQNREKLIDTALAGRMADSIRDACKSPSEGLHLAGLSRRAFHDYLRLLVHQCFRVDRGAHLSSSSVESPRLWSSQDCFEEAVRSPRNLAVVLYRPTGSASERPAETDKSIEDALVTMQDELFFELGIRVPKIELREDPLLGRNDVRLQINDLRLPPTQVIGVHEFLVNETLDHLSTLSIKGRAAENPANGNECAIVHGDNVAATSRQAGYTTRGRNEYVALAASAQIRKYGGSFIVLGTVEYELDQLRNATSGLVEIVAARFDLNSIVRLLRYLVDEEISYRNLTGILEALLTTRITSNIDFAKYIVFNSYAMSVTPVLKTRGNESDNVRTYGEAARSSLKRYISNKYTRGQNTLVVYLLDPKVETLMKESSERSLSEDEREDVLKALEQEVGDLPASAQKTVILTSIDARRALRDLIAIEFPNIAVLSFQELSPDLNIQPIARISLS